MLVFFIFFYVFTFSVGIKEISVYEQNTNSLHKVGIAKDGKYEPYFSPNSKKIRVTKSRTCGSKLFPHGMYIDKSTKSPMMYCEENQCKAFKESECEKNVLIKNCSGYFQWISGFMSHKNGSSDITKVECCRFKEITFSTFVKFINFTLTEDYTHEITVKDGSLKSFDYIANVKKVATSDNSTVYSAAVYRMECHSFSFDDGLLKNKNEIAEKLNKAKTSGEAKMDASQMRLLIAAVEKSLLSGGDSYLAVLHSTEFPDRYMSEIRSLIDFTWPSVEKHISAVDAPVNENMMFTAARYRLIAAEMAVKSPFGYYYKDMTMPLDREEILKRYKFPDVKPVVKKVNRDEKEVEMKTFERHPIPYSGGILETDGGSTYIYERNAAPDASKDPQYNWLIKNDDRFLTYNDMSTLKLKKQRVIINATKAYMKDSCGKDSFPHGAYIDRLTNSLMMICEPHLCLKPEKIECFLRSIDSCRGYFQWVAGFKTKQNSTILDVECCRYKDKLDIKYLKNVRITNDKDYEHEVIVENRKLISINIFNNVHMYKSDTQGDIYELSVFRMKCPKGDEPAVEKFPTDYFYDEPFN